MLALKNVSYSTPPPSGKSILNGACLTVKRGRNTVVFGDNGSGKTTLAKILLKLILPSDGQICGGTRTASAFFEDVESQLLFTRVGEELKSSGSGPVMEKCIDLLELGAIMSSSALELSYSQKARVALACAYIAERPFIIIDSPPRDECIDRALQYFSQQESPTHLLLLPDGDRRFTSEQWKKMRIYGGRIEDLN